MSNQTFYDLFLVVLLRDRAACIRQTSKSPCAIRLARGEENTEKTQTKLSIDSDTIKVRLLRVMSLCENGVIFVMEKNAKY